MHIRAFIISCVAAVMLFAIPAYGETIEQVATDNTADTVVAKQAVSTTTETVDTTASPAATTTDSTDPAQESAPVANEATNQATISSTFSSTTSSTAEDTSISAQASTTTAPSTVAGSQATYSGTTDMYRLYNPNSGEHFYTASDYERDSLDNIGWNYEGIGWVAPQTSDYPVFRLYNSNAGDHHYTLSAFERDSLVGVGWNYEGIGWYSEDPNTGLPVYRQYNPNAVAGAHNFTTSQVENDSLVNAGWSAEGTAWYAAQTNKTIVAPYLAATVSANENEVPETIVSYATGDTTYLLMPSHTSLSSVVMSAFSSAGTTTQLVLSDNGTYTDYAAGSTINLNALGASPDSNGTLRLNFKDPVSGHVFPLVIMQSDNIAALYVNSVDIASQGRSYVESDPTHNAKANVVIYMVNANGDVVYAKDDFEDSKKQSTIKGRGNSTWGIGDKKPYQISLSKKWDLINENGDKTNTNTAKKWILLSNSNDVTMLHNAVAYDMGLQLGMTGCEGRFVDLYYDGEFRGTYYLCEKVEIKDGRVLSSDDDLEGEIESLNEASGIDITTQPTARALSSDGYEYQYVAGDIKTPTDYSGGYLLEHDTAYYSSETCWFDTSVGHFVIKSPEYCSKECVEYIRATVQDALNKLSKNEFNNGASFDLETLGKTYLVSEFFKNIDAFNTSTYFYKGSDSNIVYSAPLWDFDASTGVRTDWTNNLFRKYEDFAMVHCDWVTASSTLESYVRDLYRSTFEPLVSSIVLGDKSAQSGYLHSIAYYRDQIAQSQRMNEVLFGLTAFDNELTPFATYDQNVRYMTNWITYRTQWFSTNIDRLSGSPISNPTSVYEGVDYSDVYDYYYYLASNPDVAAAFGGDPSLTLQHFVEHGMSEGRTSCLNFNWSTYRDTYADVRAAFGDDKAAYYRHYIEYGFKEGRLI